MAARLPITVTEKHILGARGATGNSPSGVGPDFWKRRRTASGGRVRYFGRFDHENSHLVDGERDDGFGHRFRPRRGHQGSADAALVDFGRRGGRAQRPQAGFGQGRLRLEGCSGRGRRRRRRDDGSEGDGGGRQSADRLADPRLFRDRLRGSRQARRHHLTRQKGATGTKSFPQALQKFTTTDGKWDAVPVNIHSVNWVWINKAAMEKISGTEPKNFDEFVALLDKAKKAAGIIPLALGGQPWQEATLFDFGGRRRPAASTSTRRRSSTWTRAP